MYENYAHKMHIGKREKSVTERGTCVTERGICDREKPGTRTPTEGDAQGELLFFICIVRKNAIRN